MEKGVQVHSISAYLKNSTGGKDKVKIQTNKHPFHLNKDDYEEIYNMLKDRMYEGAG